MSQNKTQDVIDAIKKSWCKETSSSPDAWTPERPSLGQCAVTTLVLQDHIGGCLMRSTVDDVSHYWLRSYDEQKEIDITKDQFDDFHFSTEVIERTRQYVLSYEETKQRYLLLKDRVSLVLHEQFKQALDDMRKAIHDVQNYVPARQHIVREGARSYFQNCTGTGCRLCAEEFSKNAK